MRHLTRLVLFVLAILISTGCSAPPMPTNGTATEPTPSPMIDETPAPATATATRSPTPPPPPPGETATAAPPATPTPTAVSATALYGFQVSYTLEIAPDDPTAEGPPEGMRWIVVVAAIQNDSAEALAIERQSLTLIDQDGQRYTPDEPTEETQPPLVGARIGAGEDLLGLVRFTIPEDANPDALEWCSQGTDPCREPLIAPIP